MQPFAATYTCNSLPNFGNSHPHHRKLTLLQHWGHQDGTPDHKLLVNTICVAVRRELKEQRTNDCSRGCDTGDHRVVCLEEERVVVVEKAVANGKNFAGDGSNRGPSVEFLEGV